MTKLVDQKCHFNIMISRFTNLKNKLLNKAELTQEKVTDKVKEQAAINGTDQEPEPVVLVLPTNPKSPIEVSDSTTTSTEEEQAPEEEETAEEIEAKVDAIKDRTANRMPTKAEIAAGIDANNYITAYGMPTKAEITGKEVDPEEEEEEEQHEKESKEDEYEEEEEESDDGIASPAASPIPNAQEPLEVPDIMSPKSPTPEQKQAAMLEAMFNDNWEAMNDLFENMNTVDVVLLEVEKKDINEGPYYIVAPEDRNKPPKTGRVRIFKKIRIVDPRNKVPTEPMFKHDLTNQTSAMRDFNKCFPVKTIKMLREVEGHFHSIIGTLDLRLLEIQRERDEFFLDEERMRKLAEAGRLNYVVDKFEASMYAQVCFHKAKAWRAIMGKLDYYCCGTCTGLRALLKTIDKAYWDKISDLLERGEEYLELMMTNLPWNLYEVFQYYPPLN